LVDHASQDSFASHRRVDRDHHIGVVIRWELVDALVWTVLVEVTLLRDQHRTRVALVIDQHSVGTLGAEAADEPLRVRDGGSLVAALGDVMGVAEAAHELGPGVGDTVGTLMMVNPWSASPTP
jgi:hypothetical protein